MAENLEEYRQKALEEMMGMREQFQNEMNERARNWEIGAIQSDDPLDWDPEVRKAKANLLRARGLLGMVPPSMYTENVEACERRLQEAIEKARQRLTED